MIDAGIVLYNPDIKRLKSCILSIAHSVNRVILFDNGSTNIIEIEKIINDLKINNLNLIKSDKNIGLAIALQKILDISYHEGVDWLLTLDQDSICPDNFIEKLSRSCIDNVGIIAPLFYDKRRNEKKPINCDEIVEVDFCITSGSLCNVKNLVYIGGFDTNLFIGLIDNELCFRLKQNGFKILQNNSVIIDHELGNITPSKHAKVYLILFKIFHLSFFRKLSFKREVSPLRIKYAVRNMIYLNYKYKKVKVRDWSKITLIKTIVTALFRAKFSSSICSAISEGRKEGRQLIDNLKSID